MILLPAGVFILPLILLPLTFSPLRQSVASSRRQSYLLKNPSFTVHDIQKRRGKTNEVHRHVFIWLRVIGNRLVIEKGHWNRFERDRLEMAERLYQYRSVQI